MKLENINFILNMTKDYLDGKIDFITFGLDFPYEVETRYRKMVKEDREIAVLIYDCLVEDGASLYNILSEEQLKAKIEKEYEYIIGL